MTTIKKVLYSTLFLSILFFSSNALAQDTTNVQSDSKFDPVIKMSGISPAVGATYHIGNNSRLRALGFISIDSQGPNAFDSYFLDLSYLRSSNWIIEGISTYWGVNLHIQFEDPIIGPGALVGTTYSLSDHFAIFGEAGFNVFIFDEGDNGRVGMSNSGIGLRVNL